MTEKPKESGGSTDKQADALAGQCVGELYKLVDEAVKVEAPEWKARCEYVEGLVRRAVAAENNYGEKLRELLGDKSAMEERAKKDWTAFDVQHGRLREAILKIYGSPIQPDPSTPAFRIGPRNIQNRMHTHGVAILQARKAASNRFNAWWAEQLKGRADAELELKSEDLDNSAANHVKADVTVEAQSTKQRGRPANPARHRKICEIVNSIDGNWKDEENMEIIVEKLDQNADNPPPPAWASRMPPARSWTRAYSRYPGLVIRAIQRSLDYVEKHPENS